MSDPVEKMLNQAALEALYSATYVDNFLGKLVGCIRK